MKKGNRNLLVRSAYRRSEEFFAKFAQTKALKAIILSTSLITLIGSAFFMLFHLLGLALAASVTLIILEKVFGVKINPQNFSYAP
ncbi:hypothetical protein GW915_08540 [bacterium]|nr:hypothetical protein [bacterium]